MDIKTVNSWDGLSVSLMSAFKKAAGFFGGVRPANIPEAPSPEPAAPPPAKEHATVSTEREYSRDYHHYKLPSAPITPETLQEAPPHINAQDGKTLVWAYIGKDDPTRGDSRGANGLAQEVARLMGGRMVYVDHTMLEKNFAYTSGIRERLESLIARDGAPDIVIGTSSHDLTDIRSCKPTMIVSNINESIDKASRDRTDLVPHDLTPETLAAAGSEFRKKNPHIRGPLYTVMLSTFYSQTEYSAIRKLAHILAFEDGPTLYFCPNRRVNPDAYTKLAHTLYNELLSLGIADRVRVMTPTFDDMRNGYNPYRGLIAESDHMLLIGDSHSIVSEAVCGGRPLYLTDDLGYYKNLRRMGYVKDFMSEGVYPLQSKRLDPISITSEVAGKLAGEFDRMARLRTLGAREEADMHRRAYQLECEIAQNISAEMAAPFAPARAPVPRKIA